MFFRFLLLILLTDKTDSIAILSDEITSQSRHEDSQKRQNNTSTINFSKLTTNPNATFSTYPIHVAVNFSHVSTNVVSIQHSSTQLSTTRNSTLSSSEHENSLKSTMGSLTGHSQSSTSTKYVNMSNGGLSNTSTRKINHNRYPTVNTSTLPENIADRIHSETVIKTSMTSKMNIRDPTERITDKYPVASFGDNETIDMSTTVARRPKTTQSSPKKIPYTKSEITKEFTTPIIEPKTEEPKERIPDRISEYTKASHETAEKATTEVFQPKTGDSNDVISGPGERTGKATVVTPRPNSRDPAERIYDRTLEYSRTTSRTTDISTTLIHLPSTGNFSTERITQSNSDFSKDETADKSTLIGGLSTIPHIHDKNTKDITDTRDRTTPLVKYSTSHKSSVERIYSSTTEKLINQGNESTRDNVTGVNTTSHKKIEKFSQDSDITRDSRIFPPKDLKFEYERKLSSVSDKYIIIGAFTSVLAAVVMLFLCTSLWRKLSIIISCKGHYNPRQAEYEASAFVDICTTTMLARRERLV